ncbi:MAG: hypothetical protein M0Q41_10685 [Bacteroidales bacterium]|nr:hypothetical protein [Bacteroidales bacterium]
MSDFKQSRSNYLKIMYGGLHEGIESLQLNAVNDNSYEAVQLNNQLALDEANAVLDSTAATDRNWWQRIWDTVEEQAQNVARGLLNFADDIGDFVFNFIDWAGGGVDWAQTARDYDWQAPVEKAMMLFNGSAMLSGDFFTADYWTGWTPEEIRAQQAKKAAGSYTAELKDKKIFGTDGQSFIRGVGEDIGYLIPSIGVGIATGGSSAVAQGATRIPKAASLATMGAGAFAGKTNVVYEETGEMGKAMLTGLATAAVEVGTELIFPGGKVAGVIGEQTATTTFKAFAKEVAKEMLQEGAEEAISGILEPLVDSIWKGKSAFYDDKGNVVYGTKEFWFSGENSVMSQAASGAAIGGILSGTSTWVNSTEAKKTFGKDGVNIMNNMSEISNLYAEMNALEQQGKQNTKKYQQLAEKVAKPLAELAAQLQALKDGKFNLNETQKKNIGRLFSDPTAFNKAVANGSIDNYIETAIEEFSSKDKIMTRNLFNDLQTHFGTEISLEFVDMEGDTKASFDSKNNVIKINNKYTQQFAPALAHEFIGHLVGDTMDATARQSLVEKIVDTSWYKENGAQLRKAYTNSAEYKALEETGRKAYWQSELINNYIEATLDQGSSAKSIKMISDAFIRNTLLNRLLANFSKVNNYKLIQNNAILSEFIKSVNTTLQVTNKAAYSALQKFIKGETLTELEQKLYEKYKDIFEFVKEVQAQEVFSKETANSENFVPYEENEAQTVKKIANEKEGIIIKNIKTIDDVYKAVEASISESIGEEFKIKDRKKKVRRLFEEFNLSPNEAKKSNVTKFVKDILNVELVGQNLLGEGTLTYGDYLKYQTGKTLNQIIAEGTNLFYNVLASQAVDSKTTTNINKLIKWLDNAKTVNAELKATLTFVKKLNTIKKNLGNAVAKFGNTGNIDTSSGAKGLFYQYFKQFGFTNRGYLSMTNIARLQTMINDGSFQNFINSVLNPYKETVGLSSLQTQADAIIELATDLSNSRGLKQTHMNYAQIEAFNNLNKAIYKLYQEYNDGVREAVRNKATKLIERAQQVKERYNSAGINGKLKAALFDALSPKDIIAYLTGGTHTDAFTYLYNDMIKKPYEAQIGKYVDFLEQRDQHIKELKKHQHKKIKIGNLKVSKYVLYQFYLNMLSPDNLVRMQNSNLTFTDSNRISKQITFNELENAMKQHLTAKEMANLDAIFKLYNTEVKAYVESMSEKILGFKVSRENYYPIVSSNAFRITDMTNPASQKFNVNALNNGRLLKLTNRKTVIEINVNPINLFNSYIESMTITGEIGLASQELTRVMQLKDANGNSFMSLIQEYMPDAKTYMASIMNKLIGNQEVISRSGFFDKMVGRFSTAVLGLNPRPMLKQFASFFTAWEKVGFTTGLKTFLNPTSFYRVLKNRAYLKANNGIFRYRIYNHEYVRGVTLSAGAEQFTTDSMRKVTSFALSGMEFMDRMTTYATFALAEEYVQKTHGYKIGTQENLKLANEMLTDFILETQSNSDRIAISRVRAGEKGVIVKNLFGLFQSDAQNKAGLLFNILNDMNNQSKDIKQIKADLLKVTDADVKQSLNGKLGKLMADQNKLGNRARAYFAGLVLSGIITMLADTLSNWLYDREEIEEFDFANKALEVLLNSTIDWIPYFNSVYNWLEFDGASFAPIENINEFIIAFKNLFESIGEGKINSRDFVQLAIKLAELMGFPAGNLSKLIQGTIGNFNPELAYQYRNVLYGASQSFLGREVNTYIEKGNLDKAEAALSFNFQLYKFDIDDVVAKQFIEFKKNDVDISISNTPTYYTDAEGVKHNYNADVIAEFKKVYNVANIKIKEAMNTSIYQKLSLEEKAKAIKKISDVYYEIAKGEATSRLAMLVAKTQNKVNVGMFATTIVYLQNKYSEVPNRKELIIAELNKISGLTRSEKLLILHTMGYSVADNNKVAVIAYLQKLGLSAKVANNFFN